MRRKLLHVLMLAFAWALALPLPALADDSDLLNRVTPAPNVVVIFDTSQSMTWYRYTGSTRGDEYTGWTGDNTPMARMAMAKTVMSTVVDTFFDKLRLGLASYAEGGTPANPNALVRIKQYYYWCGKTGTFCTNANNPNPPRQYFTISPGTANSPLQLWRDSTNLNMPTQNTFTLNWALDSAVSPNPRLNTNTSGGGSPYQVCRWTYTQTNYNHSGGTTGTSSGTLDTSTPCPAVGTQRTLTETETFNNFNAGDDPTPWKYREIRTWSGGTALFSAGCAGPGGCTTQYASNQGSGWTNYRRVYTFSQQVTITPPPATTTYSWTYFYKGTCTDGCSGYLTISQTTASQSTSSPVLPSPLAVPFVRVYTWSGNNYEMNPPSAENSCPAGNGITMLVDTGGAPDKNTLKNYFGTGTNRQRELHGANFYTPLATSLDTVLQYFMNPSGAVQSDPQKDCRRNYVILVTDGGESCALVPPTGPGSPGEKALALRNASINAFGGALTYVVALDGGNFSATEQAVLADIAAKGSEDGLGTFYSASSPSALLLALNAIIGSILNQQYSFVNPVVPTVRGADNLMLIQGSLVTPAAPPADPNTPLWQGVLEAFPLDSTGNLSITAQHITEAPLWEAGTLLAARSPATRTITTVVGGSQVDFQPTATVRPALNVTQDVTGDGAVTTADPDRVIQIVRGGPTGTQPLLGDIFHSVPIIVGPPSSTFVDRSFDPANPSQLLSLTAAPDTFALFRGSQATRQRVVITGTNAGVLHAFNAGTFDSVAGRYNTGDGAEVWAFIPPQMLPKLQALAVNGGHQYFVDGPPHVGDVWLDLNNDGVKAADGSEWRTVLVGGFRQGSSGLYALDVTNTASPVFMWTYATTGQSWSEPAFGKVKVKLGGRLVDRWVVFVGDGYDPAGVNGRKVHVIDLQTGKALWQFPTTAPVAAAPMVADLNSDGYVDRVYVGTVAGDVLRLDVSAVGQAAGGADVDPSTGVMVANWSGSVFFAAGASQPFYTKVAATMDPQGNLWIFVGSGDRSDPLSLPATRNRIYGIKDPYQGAPVAALTEADLTDMTGNNTLTPSAVTGAGWFIVLRVGEKEFSEASLVFNQQVFFTTFMPANTTCGDLGAGTIYMVFYLTGGGVTDTALFRANPPVASSRIYQINAGATSRPVLTTGVQGSNAVVYLGNSNMLTLTPSFSTPTSIRSTRFWRRLP